MVDAALVGGGALAAELGEGGSVSARAGSWLDDALGTLRAWRREKLDVPNGEARLARPRTTEVMGSEISDDLRMVEQPFTRGGVLDPDVPGKRAEEMVTWVDEGGVLRAGRSPGMRPDAHEYQSNAPGARSNVVTGRGQAPYLEYVDSDGNIIGAKFDSAVGRELIDRKLNPFFSPKAVGQATRQAAVAEHFGLQAVWELPTPEAVAAANRFLIANNVNGITVRLAP